MEQVIDPESEIAEVEIELQEEEPELLVPWSSEKWEDSVPKQRSPYGQVVGGLIAIVSLLFVPFVTFLGMVILVLIVEIYIIDWTYSKINLLRTPSSRPSTVNAAAQPFRDMVDQKNPRTDPKDKFAK